MSLFSLDKQDRSFRPGADVERSVGILLIGVAVLLVMLVTAVGMVAGRSAKPTITTSTSADAIEEPPAAEISAGPTQ
jgi:hypothetical protein